ncbi:MAG: hypothetical protein LBO06_06080 [Bacteroidales bacterium]|jgi:hypothetical protein|nr:hypothetical protein [Bacteroidales bacterium]
MKKFFILLTLTLMSQISFAQPPHPGSDSGNSTGNGRRPERNVNEIDTPIATGTSLIATLVVGYAIHSVRKKEDK